MEICREIFSTIFFLFNFWFYYCYGRLPQSWYLTKTRFPLIELRKKKLTKNHLTINIFEIMHTYIYRLGQVSKWHKLCVCAVKYFPGGKIYWRVNLKCVKIVLSKIVEFYYAIVLKFPFDWTLNFDYGKRKYYLLMKSIEQKHNMDHVYVYVAIGSAHIKTPFVGSWQFFFARFLFFIQFHSCVQLFTYTTINQFKKKKVFGWAMMPEFIEW